MKKLSVLVALILCVTVGGVYAAWIYSGSTINAQTEPFVNKMGELRTEGEAGSYHFSENTIDFAIEPNNQDDKRTTLVWGTGKVTLTFEAAGDITDADLAKALNASVVVVSENIASGMYEETQIYTIVDGKKIQLTESSWQHTDGTNIWTVTINASELEGFVTVADYHLPTADEYSAFVTAHGNVKFKLQVTPAA